MKRKISPEETKKLFLFCHKHFVYHYDLQIELVDHLASAIEEQWENDPDLTFQEGLKVSFGKFGITGFSKIKAQKQKELSRKYNCLLWKYLIEYYRWPKMLLTICFTICLSLVFQFVESIAFVLFPYFALLTVSALIYYFKIAPKHLQIKTVPGKKFMLAEQLKQVQFATILLCQLPISILNITRYIDSYFIDNLWILVIVSFFTVSLNIILFGYFFYIPKKVKEHFMEYFSEFAE